MAERRLACCDVTILSNNGGLLSKTSRVQFLFKSWPSWSAMHIVRLPGEYVRIYIGIVAA